MSFAEFPLSSSEFTFYLFIGLNSEYDAFVALVTACLEPMSNEELYSLRLTHESRIAHAIHLPFANPLSVNYISNTSQSRGRGSSRGPNHHSYHGHGRGCTSPHSIHSPSSQPPLFPIPNLLVKSTEKLDTMLSNVITNSTMPIKVSLPTLFLPTTTAPYLLLTPLGTPIP